MSGDPNLFVLCYLDLLVVFGWSCHSDMGGSFPLVPRSLQACMSFGTPVHVSKFSITPAHVFVEPLELHDNFRLLAWVVGNILGELFFSEHVVLCDPGLYTLKIPKKRGDTFCLFISRIKKGESRRGRRCHTNTMIEREACEAQKWTSIRLACTTQANNTHQQI